MSKTDKTHPSWIRTEEWEPVHDTHCVNAIHRSWFYVDPKDRVECNLPTDPPKHYDRTRQVRRHSQIHIHTCFWEPDTPSYYSKRGRSFYPRAKSVAITANLMERGTRTKWRMARQELLQTTRPACVEGQNGCRCWIDATNEILLPDPRHRNFALWDRW